MAAPLLPPLRRWLAPAVIAALLVPSLGMVIVRPRAVSMTESRVLAPLPPAPRDPAALARTPRAVDAFLGDHFAFRDPMTALYGKLRWKLGIRTSTAQVVQGAPGWLLLNQGLLRSIGAETDKAAIDGYAKFVCGLGERMAARGKPFLFAMIPGTAAIYPESLPNWARPASEPTAYDLLQDKTRACNVASVDLRRAMTAAKETGQLYRRRDSHWTPRGALIGYNLLVSALGRPDWTILPNEAIWRSEPAPEDDLARMAGIAERATEAVDAPHLFAFKSAPGEPQPIPGLKDNPEQPAYVVGAGAGPTVLVIGDSYTRHFMPPYFAPFVGRLAWIHHRQCGVDLAVLDKVNPDYVILATAERYAVCENAPPSG